MGRPNRVLQRAINFWDYTMRLNKAIINKNGDFHTRINHRQKLRETHFGHHGLINQFVETNFRSFRAYKKYKDHELRTYKYGLKDQPHNIPQDVELTNGPRYKDRSKPHR